jgi:hypothetical protein
MDSRRELEIAARDVSREAFNRHRKAVRAWSESGGGEDMPHIYDILDPLIVEALSAAYAAGQQAEREKGCETCVNREPTPTRWSSRYMCLSLSEFCDKLGNRCGRWEARA